MFKVVSLMILVASISGCLPYFGGYNNSQMPYYNNNYNDYNAQSNQMSTQPYQAQQFDDELEEIGYNEEAAVESYSSMMNNQMPTQQPSMQNYNQSENYNQSGYNNQHIQQQQQQQAPMRNDRPRDNYSRQLNQNNNQPYYDQNYNQAPQMTPELQRNSVIGVGKTLDMRLQRGLSQVDNNMQPGKLIMPNAWRMAHPSIGKGLELANQSERFQLNQSLNNVTSKAPVEFSLAGLNVSLISLMTSSTANSKGFLCKDVYLITPNRAKSIDKMWGKFCRHPNWNEWVLTQW